MGDFLREIVLFVVRYAYWPALALGIGWLVYGAFVGKEIGRRMVFLFVGLTVAGAVIKTLQLPVKETTVVRAVYDTVDRLGAGSTILLSLDYDPSSAPELEPMATAIVRHCFARDINICFMTLWGTGGAMITSVTEKVIHKEFPEKTYGVEYCNVGYKAGNEAVLRVIATDFRKTFPVDVFTTNLDSLPLMKKINSCADFDYVIAIGSGRPGIKEWVEFVADPAGVLLGGGAAAVSAPQLYPYYPGQLNGILGGTKGASEYEAMLVRGYPQFKDARAVATEIMGPQTVAHVLIIVLILVGNISYFRSRRKAVSG